MSEDKPFTPVTNTVTLKNGKVVPLPRLTLGKIMLVTDGVTKLTDAVKEKAPGLFEIFAGSKDNMQLGADIMKIVPSVLPVVLHEVVDVLSAYTGIGKPEILDEWDAEDLVNVATPFFASILEQGNHLLNPLKGLIPKPQAQTTEEIEASLTS
jgi:hypothetical protein